MYYAVISILMLIVCAFCTMVFIRRRRRQGYMNEIDLQFRRFWSGREEDELQAWYCVRFELMRRGSLEKHLRYVDKQIREVDRKKMLSCFSIDENGDIRREQTPRRVQIR